jgi:hypothetical protein
MLKHALAILTVTTVPAMASGNVISSHEVRFDQVTFECGKTNEAGKAARFIRTNPGTKYIPEQELSANDPLAKSWDITYRIICEGGWKQSGAVANLGNTIR